MQDEADKMLELCEHACETAGHPRQAVEPIVRDHLVFFASSPCDDMTRERACRLYRTENPIVRRQRQRGHTPFQVGCDSEVS